MRLLRELTTTGTPRFARWVRREVGPVQEAVDDVGRGLAEDSANPADLPYQRNRVEQHRPPQTRKADLDDADTRSARIGA